MLWYNSINKLALKNIVLRSNCNVSNSYVNLIELKDNSVLWLIHVFYDFNDFAFFIQPFISWCKKISIFEPVELIILGFGVKVGVYTFDFSKAR